MLLSGERYPLLFCGEISNFHGNRPFGRIVKRNMYTSIVDILEGLRSNHPVNPLHIVQALLDLLANSDPVGMQQG